MGVQYFDRDGLPERYTPTELRKTGSTTTGKTMEATHTKALLAEYKYLKEGERLYHECMSMVHGATYWLNRPDGDRINTDLSVLTAKIVEHSMCEIDRLVGLHEELETFYRNIESHKNCNGYEELRNKVRSHLFDQ